VLGGIRIWGKMCALTSSASAGRDNPKPQQIR
jgi:hypothetical protein